MTFESKGYRKRDKLRGALSAEISALYMCDDNVLEIT